MAVVTATTTYTPEGNTTEPLANKRLFKYRITADNGDTFASGLQKVTRHAVTYVSDGAAAAIALDADTGTFTFAATAPGTFDLLVWVDG